MSARKVKSEEEAIRRSLEVEAEAELAKLPPGEFAFPVATTMLHLFPYAEIRSKALDWTKDLIAACPHLGPKEKELQVKRYSDLYQRYEHLKCKLDKSALYLTWDFDRAWRALDFPVFEDASQAHFTETISDTGYPYIDLQGTFQTKSKLLETVIEEYLRRRTPLARLLTDVLGPDAPPSSSRNTIYITDTPSKGPGRRKGDRQAIRINTAKLGHLNYKQVGLTEGTFRRVVDGNETTPKQIDKILQSPAAKQGVITLKDLDLPVDWLRRYGPNE